MDVKTIYMLGIGGIAMGTLATMLREKGYNVAGSDQNLYPPMSTHLESLAIPLCQGYSAENPSKFSPDMVIIGNVIRRDNPEAQSVLAKGYPYLSMPQAIDRFFLGSHQSMVVAGTHGKSTTSSLLAWVLASGGLDPSVFVGAFMKNWDRSYRIGSGPYMVLEGDEYDTAFFDKGPKFLHYRPHVGIVTSVEFDHADIFADFQAVYDAFRRFVHLIPADGYLITNGDDPHCVALARECGGTVLSYGWSEDAHLRIIGEEYRSGEVRFTCDLSRLQVLKEGEARSHGMSEGPAPQAAQKLVTLTSLLPGRHNVANTVSVLAAASVAGLSVQEIQEALLTFRGVKRRQDILGEPSGILVMDDFAHHPTAVRETIRALRLFYPERRLIVAFEPRTNSSRRRVFQEAYAAAFDEAHCVCIKEPPGMEAIQASERLDTEKLVEDIRRRGADAHYFSRIDDVVEFLAVKARPGDLVACMSNGSFDGLTGRLLKTFQRPSGP